MSQTSVSKKKLRLAETNNSKRQQPAHMLFCKAALTQLKSLFLYYASPRSTQQLFEVSQRNSKVS